MSRWNNVGRNRGWILRGFLVMFGLSLGAATLRASAGTFTQLITWTELPVLSAPGARQLAKPVVVESDGRLLVAGAAGSDQAWELDHNRPADGWRAVTVPVDFGRIGLVTGDARSVMWIKPDRSVERLQRQPAADGWRTEPLGSLPAEGPAVAATRLGDALYVALAMPRGEVALWSLDLNRPSAWTGLGGLPRDLGARPRLVAQDNGRGMALFVFGGMGADAAAYQYSPAAAQWRRLQSPPVDLSGYNALPSGIHHLVLGDSAESGQEWVYHTVTDSWARSETTLPAGYSLAGTLGGGWLALSAQPDGVLQWQWGRIRDPRVGFKSADYVVLVAYFSMLLGMGWYFSKSGGTTHDFFLAGGRIPWWAAGLSIYGTQLSAITFMSIPAKTYSTDWSYFLINIGIVAVAPLVVCFFLPFYIKLKVTTVYEYLEHRFSLPVRLLGSAAFILFQFGRMGIVLYLPALALAVVTGIDMWVCIVAIGVVCTIYTVTGGMEAVVWTDVLQVGVLGLGALLCLGVMVAQVDGGLAGMWQEAAAAGKFRVFDWTPSLAIASSWALLLNWPTQLIPYTSDQAVIQRYLTTKDEQAARRGIWTNAAITLPGTLLFFMIGTALWVFFRSHPGELAPGLAQHDAIFPWFIVHQLPAGISGLLVAGVFAASMSSVDSSLNSVSAAVVTDFYRRLRPGVSDRQCLRLAKICTVVFGVLCTGLALLMAAAGVRSLWDRFNEIMGLIGGGLAGMFLLGIFTRRTNAFGVLVGFICSAGVQYYVKNHTDLVFLVYSICGMLTCVTVGYLVSLLRPGSSRDVTGLTLHT